MAAHLADRIRARLDEDSRRALEHLDKTILDSDPARFLRLVDLFAVDVIKGMAVDAVQKANSGHPGGPCSSVDFAYILFTRHLKASPDAGWADRDRFVLSGGHMSMLLYSMLYWQGRLEMKDLENFRQLGSRTQGHPVVGFAPGIECTTGPLGQGFANGVGMAIAETYLRSLLGPELVDHHTYVLATDGDIQEGVCHEAASLAGHLKLGKLIVFYDANDIQLASPVAATMTEDIAMSFRAKGWHVIELPDGHDHRALDGAIAASKDASDRPSIIIGKTVIARGTKKAGSVSSHGSPLGDDVIAEFKKSVGHPVDRVLWAPEAVREIFQEALSAGETHQTAWKARAAAARQDPAKAILLDLVEGRENETLGRRVTEVLKGLDLSKPATVATRSTNGKVMAALKEALPHLIGGSADLSNSTKTDTFEKDVGMFPKDLVPGAAKGRGIAFGVREHAMGSIANGMAYHGGVLPFTGTFLAFADYMRPAVRLAAISHLPSLFIFTHDSVFLGEDGETHQPVEQVEALRLIPRVLVIRPGDAWESAASWDLIRAQCMGPKPRPVCLILSRQDLPVLEGAKELALQKIHQGAYILPGEGSGPVTLQLVATGSEVHLAVAAARTLRAKRGVNVRVVSMPCQEIFREQPASVRHAILDPAVTTVSIEAGVSKGWHALLGDRGHTIAIDSFGESAPLEALQEKFGFTEAAVVARLETLL